MLQQMSSSPGAHIGELAPAFGRCLDARLCDVSSEGSSDAADDTELPQCKIRRNYNCTKCTFYTQNPRAYLVHTRDAHFVKLKIYDCPHCVYASKHHQKLVRHIKMVHEDGETQTRNSKTKSSTNFDSDYTMSTPDVIESAIKIEDMVEEVEDYDDMMMEVEETADYSPDNPDDIDVVGEAATEQAAPSNLSKTKGNVKFFTCDKCTYVTHIRARFTKHVKYHSMPMIKCIMCDFRTPYKWNLDRHMKNHGGSGSFHCSMCNFTADIKQSLTVHEMNHHTPPVGHSVASRRRNRVGASDTVFDGDAVSAALPKEEEGSGDSRSSHSVSEMGLQYADREIVNCKSDSNDGSPSDAIDKRDSQHSPCHSSDESKKQSRKIPRPIPQLIPLNSSTPNQKQTTPGEPPQKKFKESSPVDLTDSNSPNKVENLPVDITLIPVNNNPSTKESSGRKPNVSFFDRLKERLLTETGEEGSLICKNCGFESKCLSEHSVHEKNCMPQINKINTNTNASLSSLSSTRCQYCRHRCKSSADLYVHMQNCGKKEKSISENNADIKNDDSNDTSNLNQEKEAEKHPMENVVFVWNNINQDNNKFYVPLDININDDSTLPEAHKNFDIEIVDENETMNLSPSQAVGRKVFKCPHCPFFSTTASRFHVHIVGHLNKKPFECSLCKYKSNWRWDITKHIKLKSARDPEHNDAKVLMTDETGRRNYSKYNKFLAMPVLNEYGENEFHYLDASTTVDGAMELDESFQDMSDAMNSQYEMQPLNLQTQHNDDTYDMLDNRALNMSDMKKTKKTMWKCKKCNYKDPSKEALIEHVREHSKDGAQEEPAKPTPKKSENTPDPADLAYRCGHCHQLSNWKHVIQRHCRLKHDGIIKVITTVKPKPDPVNINDINDTCNKCPYRTSDKKQLIAHLQQHQPSAQSIFKCYFCPYFVKDEPELAQHLLLHGITEPEDYISKNMGGKSPIRDLQSMSTICPTKRHKCTECPYETNSKSQYMYHEQFHRTPSDTPYKCPECNYSVSKRHLLHQHLRVHGIITKRLDVEYGLDQPSTSSQNKSDKESQPNFLEEIPYVWVSAKNEFHKMFKCRYCSYVNSQKCKIPNHEKIHCIVFENSDTTIYKCLECKFTCDNAGRLAEHSKSHGEIYGRIYCPVEDDIPDEEQITKLRKVIEMDKVSNADNMSKEEGTTNENREIKLLYFCHKCPARFFEEQDLQNHDKFHYSSYPNKCNSCEFSVPEEDELVEHATVHTDEYHTKTKMLKFVHNSHHLHRQPRLELVHCPTSSTITWISLGPNIVEDVETGVRKEKHVPKQYFCKLCPAKFFKSSALSYHMGLHGGEGEHKCKKCNYAVKNIGNLAKHEMLHENDNKSTNCDYESGDDMDFKNIPLSGTDLFQRKTEAQKRVLTDSNKLVKPNDHFPPVLQADPQFGYLMHGNPEFIYPTYLKNGRQKEKRYKCHKCPSAFEKREQYKIHLSLHGSKQRYKCEICDYSVKYYANYVQHMRKHQMNDEAQAERKKGSNDYTISENTDIKIEENTDNIKLAIKTMPRPVKSDFQQFSISDQQTLRLLQHRRSMNTCSNDVNSSEISPTKERKMHMCILCPYTNQRQDSLGNHYRRHGDCDVLVAGNHKCSYCDLGVVQSHFLREHLKTHFNYHKTLIPECFVANEDVSFTVTKLEDEGSESVDLKLDVQNKIFACNDEKLFVKIKTGELLVE